MTDIILSNTETVLVEVPVPDAVIEVFEDKTEIVEIVDAGPRGPAGPAGSRMAFHQVSGAATWTWVHNSGARPAVVLFTDDDPFVPCYTDVSYPDLNTVVIEWTQPETGWAYI